MDNELMISSDNNDTPTTAWTAAAASVAVSCTKDSGAERLYREKVAGGTTSTTPGTFSDVDSSVIHHRGSPNNIFSKENDNKNNNSRATASSDEADEYAFSSSGSSGGRNTTQQQKQQQLEEAAWQVTASTTTNTSSASNTTTSSGSDEKGGSSNNNSSGSDGGYGPEQQQQQKKTFTSSSCSNADDVASGSKSLLNGLDLQQQQSTRHYHHHHHHYDYSHRRTNQHHQGADDGLGMASSPSSGGDHVSFSPTDRHAAVVAHLPAPDSSAISSGGSGGEEHQQDPGAAGGGNLVGVGVDVLPGFHKIRSTFKRIVRNKRTAAAATTKEEETTTTNSSSSATKKNSKKPSSGSKKRKVVDTNTSSVPVFAPPPYDHHHHHHHHTEDSTASVSAAAVLKQQQLQESLLYRHQPPLLSPNDNNSSGGGDSSSEDGGGGKEEGGGGNSSSGSGTEGGYAGSASSNDVVMAATTKNNRISREEGAEDSSSSPSVSSSEDTTPLHYYHHHLSLHYRGGLSNKRSAVVCSSPGANNNSNKTAAAVPTVRQLLTRKEESNLSMSSDIADFSSGATESKVAETIKALQDESKQDAQAAAAGQSSSESITSSSNSSDGDGAAAVVPALLPPRSVMGTRKRRAPGLLPPTLSFALLAGGTNSHCGNTAHWSGSLGTRSGGGDGILTAGASSSPFVLKSKSKHREPYRPPIMSVSSDVMAHILTFLEPPEILFVLTMPFSKDWILTFTRQSELWRVLCLLEPFKAQVEEEDSDSSSSNDESIESFLDMPSELKLRFGKFRILYTSFVRCMRYLARIKDDALNGRPPSLIDYGTGGAVHAISANQNLQSFLARARGVVLQNANNNNHADAAAANHSGSDDADDTLSDEGPPAAVADAAARDEPIGVSDDGSSSQEVEVAAIVTKRSPRSSKKKRGRPKKDDNKDGAAHNKKRKVRYGPSKITQRLLLPVSGRATRSELPWSCAIYSIVNWMVGFADAEGIQTMCLKILPFLLEDEQQRMTAQRAGLTDVVLRDMVMFPHSAQLHTAAFHTIVLLARPLGGREGMLFHTSMVNSSGIFNAAGGKFAVASGKNGIAVMLDSMRRFQSDEILQAMSCWSLVNIALAPTQKDVLIKLGGIEVTTNAMVAHPHSAEVQFRALFALINLVIPCVNTNATGTAGAGAGPQRGAVVRDAAAAEETTTEREVLDELVEEIVELVVHAMQNFCSSESILNRACLVLHNLSLTQDYHGALLWTPNCYQMLEWCLANYRTDQVLQQSAAGTLHRLQLTLSSSEALRVRFNSALALQQQISLEQAHREAVLLHEQHERESQIQQQHGPGVAPTGD